MNATALKEYQRGMNRRALVRDYLVNFFLYFGLTSVENMKLQASTLAELTTAMNELTRSTIVSVIGDSHVDDFSFVLCRVLLQNDALDLRQL